MKKTVVFSCILSVFLTGTVFAGPRDDRAAAASGPLYSEAELQNFRIDPNQIPANLKNTTLKIAISIRGLENPYLATKFAGMGMFGDYLTSIGQKFESQVLDSGGSNSVEVDNMKAFAASSAGNGIVYADPNENAIAFPLAEAMAASGGYIGTAWNKPADVGPRDLTPNWVIHTSPDNVIGGYQTAKALFEAMGGSGEVFVIQGMLGNTAAIDRFRGFEQAQREFPGINVVRNDTGNWTTATALNLVETWLPLHPNVGGIWNANDNMATGTLQALAQAGKLGQVAVVGFDGNTDIVEAIRDGNAIATISANGYLQAGYTLAILYSVWTGLLDPSRFPPNFREFATPALLINKENAAQFLASPPNFDFSRPFFFARVAD